ncbi:kinase-like protein [Heliocybe sulcata]|uniref:Kinase-like protein n=1 Tax=Heliocybe sulcata TaxID=5364 RepID=A0A5C3N5A1_9AGAM|nr:kinase-like protein [Heliocybe sulcata]
MSNRATPVLTDRPVEQILVEYKRGNARSAFRYLPSIFSSKEHKRAVLDLRGDAADAFLEFLLQARTDSTVLEEAGRPDCSIGSPPRFIHTDMALLLVRLCLKCQGCPPSLLLGHKIVIPTRDPTFAGGFEDVFQDHLSGKVVALKRLRMASLPVQEQSQMQKDILREAVIWHNLEHVNILPFMGIHCAALASTFYLVSPWMDNGNVNEYLKQEQKEGWSIDRLAGLLVGIAQGLIYLHHRRIVHGDLRGANILVDDCGHARLADFGLARIIDQTTSFTTSSRGGGSTKWMAPELHLPSQYGISLKHTPASDVYAYGCVCLELFTGKQPFPDLAPGSFIVKLIQGIVLSREATDQYPDRSLSDALWSVICRCLSSQPQDRPAIGDFLGDLSGLCNKVSDGTARLAYTEIEYLPTAIVIGPPNRRRAPRKRMRESPIAQKDASHPSFVRQGHKRARRESISDEDLCDPSSAHTPAYSRRVSLGRERSPANAVVARPDMTDYYQEADAFDMEGACSSKLALARFYVETYVTSDEQQDLDKAMQLFREALGRRPFPHPKRAWTLNQFRIRLEEQYDRSRTLHFLEYTIDLLREAISICQHPESNQTMDQDLLLADSAAALRKRYHHLGKRDDLVEATALARQVIDLRPASSKTSRRTS